MTVTALSMSKQRVMPLRLEAAIDSQYRAVLTQVSDVLWCLQIYGPRSITFRNLYNNADEAKADAVIVIEFACQRWGLTYPRLLEWRSNDL